jgi:hypothetical protein
MKRRSPRPDANGECVRNRNGEVDLNLTAALYCVRLGIAVPRIYTDRNLRSWCRLIGRKRAAYFGQASRTHHAIMVRTDRLRTEQALLATLVHELVHLRYKSYTERKVYHKVEELTGISVEEQLRHSASGRYVYKCPQPGCRYVAYFRQQPKRIYLCGFCRKPRPRLTFVGVLE